MKASEKAKEIVQKIFNEQHSDDKAILIMISTKHIALILVDEIINDYSSFRVKPYISFESAMDCKKYWEEVKTEIEKY
jgi:hypothetical protein